VQKLWTDVGFPEDLWLANFRLRKYAPFLIGGKFIPHFNSWIGHNCNLRGRVTRSVIGSNVQIGPGVKIEDSVIGNGSIIEDAKLIRGTVILPYSYINVRKNHRNIESIKNSLIISRSRGGTFLDSQTIAAQVIEKQVTIPDIDGQNKIEPLYLSRPDIRELLSR
jgi:NDP-sugar pyrophosphorylase family protein